MRAPRHFDETVRAFRLGPEALFLAVHVWWPEAQTLGAHVRILKRGVASVVTAHSIALHSSPRECKDVVWGTLTQMAIDFTASNRQPEDSASLHCPYVLPLCCALAC